MLHLLGCALVHVIVKFYKGFFSLGESESGFLDSKTDFAFRLYPNPKMDFESVESILKKDSKDQIQIRILGIHDFKRFFGKGFENNTYDQRHARKNRLPPFFED